MKELVAYNNLTLINKYDEYYIRFIGGQYTVLPCDVIIKRVEAEAIIKNPAEITNIINSYRRNIPWTMDAFIKRGLLDFINHNASHKKSDDIYSELTKFEDIKYEVYEYAMTDEFPKNGAIKVNGYSAEILCEEKEMSPLNAYLWLVKFREQE